MVLRAWSRICGGEICKLRRNLKISCLSGKSDKIADIISILSMLHPYNFKLLTVILSIMDSIDYVLLIKDVR